MKAIFLHIYYEHLWPEIAERLKKIPFEFNLYVNLVKEHTDHLIIDVLKEFPRADVIKSPNNGMDCGGQLRLLDYWLNYGKDEEFIIFLHSKGKPADLQDLAKVKETDELRNLLWSIVSPEKVPLVEAAFQDEKVGMCGVEEWHRFPGRDHGDPIPECKKFCDLLNLDNYKINSFGFIGGTMFWVRSRIFRKVFESVDIEDMVNKLPPASTGGDIHALERIFGYVVLSENFKIKGI